MKTKNPVLTILLIATLLFINLGWSDVLAHIPGLETQGDILYVRQDSSGDCLTWATACDLQTALGTAVAGFDTEIWVAAGTYKPTTIDPADRTATFELKQAVAIYGGFPTTGEPTWEQRDWETNITTLSGDLKGDDGADFANNDENSYHVVGNANTGVTSSAVLDGFTVSGGNADGTEDANGGGMRNDESSPTLTNLIFSNNYALGSGGGMYNNGASNPTLTNVTFSDNTAGYAGGGMYNYYSSPNLTNVTFSGNTALDGGGMYNYYQSSPDLSNVTFSGNTADYGGGMYNYDYSSPDLFNVTFSENSAIVYGGGIINDYYSSPTLTNVTFSSNSASSGGGMYNDNGSPELTNVTFSGNSATTSGGGMYNDDSSPTLTNVTFTSNSAAGQTNSYGGGMYNKSATSPTLTNVTFSGNSATTSGGGMYNDFFSSATLTNAIVWGNTPTLLQIYNNGTGSATITYSDIQGCGGSDAWDTTCGTDLGGNIDSDPLLGPLADHGGFTQTRALGDGSPAIDAGDPYNCPSTDQRGFYRPIDGDDNGTAICDMGAYEYGSALFLFLPVIMR